MRDVVAILGLVMLSAGCAWAWSPLGLIVPGALLLGIGIAGHVLSGPPDNEGRHVP